VLFSWPHGSLGNALEEYLWLVARARLILGEMNLKNRQLIILGFKPRLVAAFMSPKNIVYRVDRIFVPELAI